MNSSIKKTGSVVGVVGAVGVAMMLAGTARAVEIWDVSWDCTGPANSGAGLAAFPQSGGINSSTYNPDDKFTGGDSFPGWLTANGNPGGLLYRVFDTSPPPNPITKAGGWTVQWGTIMAGGGTEAEQVSFSDDIDEISVRYTLTGVQLKTLGANTSAVAPVTTTEEHTYRLVRQAASDTVELYLDENESAIASFTPQCVGCDGGNRNNIYWAPSAGPLPNRMEAAWDFMQFHSGATAPIPEPTTLALLGLGGLFLLRRSRRA